MPMSVAAATVAWSGPASVTSASTADSGATVHCPYCGEAVEIVLDPGSGTHQEYVEDCEVCCRPWRVTVAYHGDGSAGVSVEALE